MQSTNPGFKIANSEAMKRWLNKVPGAFAAAGRPAVKISNIGIKWKETRMVRSVARNHHKIREQRSFKCTLSLTIQYQDAIGDQEAPELVATPEPITVDTSCKSFLAKTKLPDDADFT